MTKTSRGSTARNGDVEIYYESFGDPADPTLVLINGLGSQCINYAPEWCERFVARGQVVKPGRTIMVCTGEVVAERTDGARQTVALMQATMMVVRDRSAVSD